MNSKSLQDCLKPAQVATTITITDNSRKMELLIATNATEPKIGKQVNLIITILLLNLMENIRMWHVQNATNRKKMKNIYNTK